MQDNAKCGLLSIANAGPLFQSISGGELTEKMSPSFPADRLPRSLVKFSDTFTIVWGKLCELFFHLDSPFRDYQSYTVLERNHCGPLTALLDLFGFVIDINLKT